jgi:hypothetical protein
MNSPPRTPKVYLASIGTEAISRLHNKQEIGHFRKCSRCRGASIMFSARRQICGGGRDYGENDSLYIVRHHCALAAQFVSNYC